MALKLQRVVELVLNTKDGVTHVVDKINKKLGGLKASAVALGASLTGALSAAVGGSIFGRAIDSSADFEEALDRVFAKTTGLTEELRTGLTEEAKRLGATTRFTATQAAQGFEVLAQSGLSASDQIKALPAVLNTAITANVSLAESASIVSDTLTVFRKKSEEAGNVADLLAKGSLLANTNISQMARAVNEAGQIADKTGLSLEGVAAATLVLAGNNIRGERAATSLRAILARLADSTGTTRKALRELGIDTSNFTDVIDQLGQLSAPQLTKALLSFDQEALPAISALVKTGVAGFKEFEKQLQDVEGTSERVAKEISDNLRGSITSFGSALESVFISLINQDVLDVLKKQVQGVTDQLRAAASSEAIGKFRDVLVNALRNAGEAAQAFVRGFDFEGAIKKLKDFSDRFSQGLDVVVTVAQTAAASIRFAFNVIQAGFATLIAGITAPLATVAQGIQSIASGLETVGAISQETRLKIDNAMQAIVDSYENAKTEAVKNAHETGDAWNSIFTSLGLVQEEAEKTQSATRGIASEAKIAAQAFGDLELAAEQAGQKAQQAREQTDDQTESLKAQAEVQQSVIQRLAEYRRLLDAQIITEDTYGTLVGATAAQLNAAQRAQLGLAEANRSTAGETDKVSAAQERYRKDLAETERLFKEGKISGDTYQATIASLKRSLEQATGAGSDLASEFEKFGLKTQTELDAAAAAAGKLFEQTRKNNASLEDQKRAFEAYAEAARKAAENATEGEKILLEARLAALDPLKAVDDQVKDTNKTLKDQEVQTRNVRKEQEKQAEVVHSTTALTKLMADALAGAQGRMKELSDEALKLFNINLDSKLIRGANSITKDFVDPSLDAIGKLRREFVALREESRFYRIQGVTEYIAQVRMAELETRIAFESQRQQADRLTASLQQMGEGGDINLTRIRRAANLAENSLKLLGEEDLAPLRQAIERANNQVEEFENRLLSLEERTNAKTAELSGNAEEFRINQALKKDLDELAKLKENADSAALARLRALENEIRRNHENELARIRERQRAREERDTRDQIGRSDTRPEPGGRAGAGAALNPDAVGSAIVKALTNSPLNLQIDGEQLTNSMLRRLQRDRSKAVT